MGKVDKVTATTKKYILQLRKKKKKLINLIKPFKFAYQFRICTHYYNTSENPVLQAVFQTNL